MKLASLFTCATALAAAASLGLAFNQYAPAIVTIATGVFVLLTVLGDYAPRARTWQPQQAAADAQTPTRTTKHALPLAV
jgi:hypothetical protein